MAEYCSATTYPFRLMATRSFITRGVSARTRGDGHQIAQPDFVDKLRDCLRRHPDMEPDDLELEILESSALEDIEGVHAVISACREIGVGFALDDFNTGFSTLNYVKRLPAPTLKIAQSCGTELSARRASLGAALSPANRQRRLALKRVHAMHRTLLADAEPLVLAGIRGESAAWQSLRARSDEMIDLLFNTLSQNRPNGHKSTFGPSFPNS